MYNTFGQNSYIFLYVYSFIQQVHGWCGATNSYTYSKSTSVLQRPLTHQDFQVHLAAQQLGSPLDISVPEEATK